MKVHCNRLNAQCGTCALLPSPPSPIGEHAAPVWVNHPRPSPLTHTPHTPPSPIGEQERARGVPGAGARAVQEAFQGNNGLSDYLIIRITDDPTIRLSD